MICYVLTNSNHVIDIHYITIYTLVIICISITIIYVVTICKYVL